MCVLKNLYQYINIFVIYLYHYILAVTLQSPRNKDPSLVVIAFLSIIFAVFPLKASVEMDKSVPGTGNGEILSFQKVVKKTKVSRSVMSDSS